ncbi:uncharacterized protein Z520_03344 [Fonsecaea multimorphosa CBS 102226]|uniref:N-acetyltransferase domain-containing protein n=1 Tax=Fonsecaea multimorphosa CBS 102226 TaxID=1442371 RepID=A0A0D2KV96_9EURO|nr:uncharacterized protein Z520_03344 [Fonsecaea multimorphosa CBS 102226]KIY00679.1 hypothetical protein Z520_03344 [Fonsecaea multimorphosa CBS 102226]OAL27962.1 hypothetical protein AYO22_03177 [Fonsecaea multimorphosa]
MSSSASTQACVPIATDSQNDVSNFISIITAAFSSTALTTAFIVDTDGTPPPYPSPLIDAARRERHFSRGILESAASGAELVHAGDWSAIALWEPPTYEGKPFIDSKAQPGPLLSEWRGRVKAAKAKYLAEPSSTSSTAATTSTPEASNSNSPSGSESDSSSDRPSQDSQEQQLRPFYHLSFLARNPAKPRVQGSINAVMMPFLERAKAEGVPAWLEATTRQAVRLYEHFGFRVVEEIVVGKGLVDALGWPAAGDKAEGVTAWAMIFDSHLGE